MKKMNDTYTERTINNQTLISIIVPVYNNAKFLKKCLYSIINQSYPTLEIIVVDDGSKDCTRSICEKFCNFDKRLHVVYTSHMGVSNARNEGIKRLHGKYFCFVDGDDWIPQTAIEKLLLRIELEKADLCYGNYTLVTPLKKREICVGMKKEFCFIDEEKEFIRFLNQIALGPCWKLYKSEVVKKNNLIFPERICLGEDQIFNLQYFSFCKKIAIENSSVYYYNRLNNSSLTGQFQLDSNKWSYEIAMKYAQLFNNKENRLVKEYLSEKFFVICFNACQHYVFFEKECDENVTDEKIIETIEMFKAHLHVILEISEKKSKKKYETVRRYITTEDLVKFKTELREENQYNIPKWKKRILEIMRRLKVLYYFKINIKSFMD